MSYLVGNPEDRFSRDEAQIILKGHKAQLNSFLCCYSDYARAAAVMVVDRIEGLVLDISGSIVDMKKRLRCRVKSCTSHDYCRLIRCTRCRAKKITRGFWWRKTTTIIRRCDA